MSVYKPISSIMQLRMTQFNHDDKVHKPTRNIGCFITAVVKPESSRATGHDCKPVTLISHPYNLVP